MIVNIVIFLFVILIASYFKGITGFGQALIATPLALILFGKYVALSSILVVGLVLGGYLAFRVKEKLDWQSLRALLAGAAIGLPVGLVVIHLVSLSVLQVAAGATAIVSALLLVFSRFKINQSIGVTLFAGSLSGFLQTSTSMSGPPVVLLLNAKTPPNNQCVSYYRPFS